LFLYFILILAIAFEVTGTLLLPLTNNFSKIYPTLFVLFLYGISFYLLSILSSKLPLAVIYASWAGMGILLVTVLSFYIYKQVLNFFTVVGIILILIGVILVNYFKEYNN
tara:strand:- start:30 stop:359 length:330 start_codon:yes stop_codon:yes gene_type:complete